MRKATENQGNTRALGEYFSPKSKVKDLTPGCRPQSFHQDTPMKPSQVPNRLSHPLPRRVLPLQTPQLCYKDRPHSRWHPPHPSRPFCSTEIVPNNAANNGNLVNRPLLMARDRLDPQQHSAPPGPRPFFASFLSPVSLTNMNTSPNGPQPSYPPVFSPATPHFTSDRSSSSYIKKNPVTESKVTLFNSGSKNVMTQNQESKQGQSSDVRSYTHTVVLRRPPISLTTSSLSNGATLEVKPPPSSGPERCHPDVSRRHSWGYQPPNTQFSDGSGAYSFPFTHRPTAPFQSQQHVPTPSSENEHKITVDLNCFSQKRYREFEHCHENIKKPCLQEANCHETQTTNSTVQGVSLVCQPSPKNTSVLELSPKTTESLLVEELACGQSACLEPWPVSKPSQSGCISLSPKHCTRSAPSMGAKQVFSNAAQNHKVETKELKSPSKSSEESVKKRREENHKMDNSSTLLSSECPQMESKRSPHAEVSSHHSGHTACSTSGLSVKLLNKSNQVGDSRKSDSSMPKPTSRPNSGSSSCRTVERRKTSRRRRPVVPLDDADELFTPDPFTYVISPACKNAKPHLKTSGETNKSPISEKGCLSSPSSSTSPSLTGSSHNKTPNSTVKGSTHAASSSARNTQICLPTVTLKRVKLENCPPKGKELKNSPISSSGRQLKNESVKSESKHTSAVSNNTSSCETDAPSSEQSHTSPCRRPSETSRKQGNEEDPIDVELDLGLSFALDMDVSESSHDSEDEQLISFQEIMDAKPPDTPEKGAFSEPSTPGHPTCQLKKLTFPSITRSGIYKNNLDQMLTEISNNKKAKEIETQLLNACNEDLLRIAEYEETEENQEEGISTEQQEFLQRYSLMSSAIREVPPGEVVFNLEKFGQIFNQDTLQLRQCMVTPQRTAQKTLLWSSPAQLRLNLNIGLFQEAYNCNSPCPTQITRFLFKMMSVHSERMVSEKLLQALCDIACTAAYQIVKNGSKQFEVWVPSLADVTLVLMNMGAAFVTLFPFENLQPPFTEGDLLEDVYIKSESPSDGMEEIAFPEHNCNNVLKYLYYCMGLCPRAYSDEELLLLLTVAGRVGLDARLILQSTVELCPLQYKIVNNFRDWDTMLPRICLALTNLTDDHHNMCLLVHLLPDNTRGKQLRRHLSMSMISKLLDGNSSYRPTQKEFQLSELRPYLPRMQPSTLLRGLLRNSKDKEEDMAILDQQSYYLCYSLLTLTNEASNFHSFTAHQKAQLLSLSSELNAHVKCDIRESEKCLYRSKVKDLVARIDTKWQMLLQRTRPLDGRLYDYWQPGDTLISSQEDEGDEEATVMEEEEDANVSGESDGGMIAEEEKEEKEAERVEAEEDMMLDEKPGDMVGQDGTVNAASKTEDATESVPCDLNQVMPEAEPEVQKEPQAEDEQMDAASTDRTDVEGETV
ncbi:SMC5-SMC6 complex localization factor protein 2 [Acanthochromis polyacanthus]|uniref:SMC5-SMC6 complex localization factor protein 2 n=1 Tax=Acanthochromis polyacanthus TaxID=80966 RepID=UPI002234C125|nr:SMC5-SMC6 complex localization factor protein 2 [Acanthochromis polyacanthus]